MKQKYPKILFTFVLDWDGGTYISQITAPTLNEAKANWLNTIDLEILETNSIQFLSDLTDGLNQDSSILVDDLKSVWRIDLNINNIQGIIHIIATCPTKFGDKNIGKEKQAYLNVLLTFILDWKGGTYVSQVTVPTLNKAKRTIVNSPTLNKAKIKWVKNMIDLEIFGTYLTTTDLITALDDDYVLLNGLQSAWCVCLSINDTFGMINVIATCQSARVGCISEASYTVVNLNTLVHDTAFMHPTLASKIAPILTSVAPPKLSRQTNF